MIRRAWRWFLRVVLRRRPHFLAGFHGKPGAIIPAGTRISALNGNYRSVRKVTINSSGYADVKVVKVVEVK